VPTLGQAQQAMAPFTPQPTVPPAGSGPLETGLPPGGQAAPAVPGLAGSAAVNVIDQKGGLDAQGLVVDGNHAAGVAKGFKLAEWLRQKNAVAGIKQAIAVSSRPDIASFDPRVEAINNNFDNARLQWKNDDNDLL